MKKLLSLFLCAVLVLCCAAPALATEPEEYPTIYIVGAHTNPVYNAQGEEVYPLKADIAGIIKETLGPCFKELAKGMVTGDYSSYAQEFNDSWAPIFEDLKLDPNGEDAALLDSAAAELLSHPCTYYTGHCTGDAAFAFLKAHMGARLHAIPCGKTCTI